LPLRVLNSIPGLEDVFSWLVLSVLGPYNPS
jgi:hypothetical protein